MVQARLTEGSVEKHLFQMALPMMMGLLGNMGIQIVDTWFISQLGAQPLAAMGFIFPVVMLFLSLSIGLSAGASSVIARSLATDDKKSIVRLITDAQSLCFCLALTAAVIGWLTVEPLFKLLGASDALIPLISSYIHIFYLNGMLTMLGMSALSSVRATGNARLQGYAMLSGAALNAVLDPILIFGLLGMPRLELQGAAIAGLLARLLTFSIAYGVLVGKMKLITSPFVNFSIIWQQWKRILHIAIPAMGTNMIIPVSTGVITALLASYGENAVAGMGVAGRLEPLMLIAYYALSAIIGPFVGQNMGAQRYDRIALAVKKSCQFSLLSGLATALFLWLFAERIVGSFSSLPEVIKVAVSYLSIVPVSYGCAGVVMVINASFNGVGKPLQATVISVMRVFILYLPLAYAGSWLLGVHGIFIAYAIVNVICAFIGYWWFKNFLKGYPLSVE